MSPAEYLPSDEDLEVALSGLKTLDQRVAYVKSLLGPLKDHNRMRANYEAEIHELQVSRDGMRDELRHYHILMADLDPEAKNALQQRFDMLGKIKAARGIVPSLRVEANKIFDRLEEALKE